MFDICASAVPKTRQGEKTKILIGKINSTVFLCEYFDHWPGSQRNRRSRGPNCFGFKYFEVPFSGKWHGSFSLFSFPTYNLFTRERESRLPKFELVSLNYFFQSWDTSRAFKYFFKTKDFRPNFYLLLSFLVIEFLLYGSSIDINVIKC